MTTLLFALFDERRAALKARAMLRGDRARHERRAARIHDGELDVCVGVDLAGTGAQVARERNAGRAFLLAFGACALPGALLDLSGLLGDTAPAATALLGSLGVLLGTVAVLRAGREPLDEAFVQVDSALERGQVLLTVPVDDECREQAEARIASSGGRTLFGA